MCYLLAGAIGLLAIFLTQAALPEAIFVALMVVSAAIYGIWWLEFRNGGVRENEPIPDQARSHS